ncbi:tail fiber assembly protein [Escherichia coli]|uniref:tail fiber assembly protein n=3 Tax=Escherichia coli TaxID=562 RepID=UPI0007518D19|nr:tail fiber assembly protein [Escherichia coli]KUU85206.1 phage tail protein [Escherichia coli]KUV75533.1 phage tail protein [Escherichia coli]KUX21459.1 phage tail protein [Escherichia coli]
MMHLKNIKAGNAKTLEQYELTKKHGVIWLYSEDGKNWYEEVKNFQPDTIKIVYDENNIIVAITKDASTLNPEGYSVVEIPDITANRRADDSGKWMFKDGAVIKRVYTEEELRLQTENQKKILLQQAELQKAALLSEAESVIQPLERAVRLNMATDEERTRLESWERYSVMVSRVDTAKPEWPQKPE